MDIQGIQSARPWTLWLWPVVFAAVIFAAELLGPRNGDTVEYSFVVPADRDANQYQYVGSLADLARSQANHYMHENGRVAVHAVAQPLCSIDRHAPWVFPLLDAALFLLLVGLTVRLLRWSQSPGTMLLLSAAIYIYIEPVRTDIAYQVNYLWVTALVTGFLLLFFSHRRVRRWWIWPLLALFGFITGESNEAFTAGIGLALVVFLMRRHRRRVTLSQLCLAISFAVGFFVNVLAPGNQVRLDSFTVPSTGELVANLLAWNWLFVPLVAVVSWRSRRGWDVRAYVRRFSFAIVAVCALAFVLLMVGTTYLGACMGMRWALTLMLLGALQGQRLSRPWQAVILLLCAILAANKLKATVAMRAKYDYLHDQYLASADGNVYLPADLMLDDYRKTVDMSRPYTWERRNLEPSAPAIRTWPDGLQGIPQDRDTNLVLRLDDRTFVAVQSKTRPRPFYLVKRPVTGGRPRVRPLRLSGPGDIDYWDETRAWRVAVYHNTYPLFFNAQVTDSIPL